MRRVGRTGRSPGSDMGSERWTWGDRLAVCPAGPPPCTRARLGVKREQVRPLVQAIGAKISSGGHRMNEFDWKQWAEVQRSC